MAYLVVDLLRSCVILSASLIDSAMVNDLLNKERERRQILRLYQKVSSVPSLMGSLSGRRVFEVISFVGTGVFSHVFGPDTFVAFSTFRAVLI